MNEYKLLLKQAEALIETDRHYIPVLSNCSALIMDSIPDLNWAGFYLLRGDTLVVGPFQGHPACIHIPVGRGVCGTCVLRDEMIVVPDVHEFPGHIACDAASASEIVVPLHADGALAGVLDLDSPRKNRFTAADAEGLQRLAALLDRSILWPAEIAGV